MSPLLTRELFHKQYTD